MNMKALTNNMLPVLLSVLVLPCLSTACKEGMACNSSAVIDGVCVRGTCLTSIPSMTRENLTFTVTIHYPETNLKMHGGSLLYIRGNGLGINWNKGTIIPIASPDTWSIEIAYTSSPDGYRCQTCADTLPLIDDKFEYRVLVDDRIDMLGVSYAVGLPISKVSTYFSNDREFHSYPWFYQKTGNYSNTTVTSITLGGDRSIALYQPPSFYENVHKTYPVIFAFDFDGKTLNLPMDLLDDPITKFGATEEFVMIGFGDYNQTERMDFLTPSTHDYFECKNGSLLDRCGDCYPENATENILGWLDTMIHKCANIVPMGGKGNDVIDFLIMKVLPAVQKLCNNRLSTTRENVGIIGYSLGGLMSCHAAWTRPNHFGFAACQSSSFWWPLEFDHDTVTSGFEFLNETITDSTLSRDRPSQRIYIDAGDLEDAPPFKMAGAAVEAAEKMTRFNGYVLDKNVWVNVYPGAVHSGLEWMLRMWKGLKTLIPSKGMATMPNNVDPAFVG